MPIVATIYVQCYIILYYYSQTKASLTILYTSMQYSYIQYQPSTFYVLLTMSSNYNINNVFYRYY